MTVGILADMQRTDGFRMPDGAKIVETTDSAVRMHVTIPTDPEGFLGRQCSDCSQHFRIDAEDYEALPDDIQLWCVYCGHRADHGDFLTDQQRERVMRAVGDLGVQLVGQAINEAFGGRPSRSSRSGFGITISFRAQPFYPQPLPGIDEERLVRVRQCSGCALCYAVFGDHRFCPRCGGLPAGLVALDALAAATARLDLLAQLPGEALPALREQGVFDRIWADTLGSLVAAVETLAGAVYRATVTDAETRLRGKGNIFQRLDDAADLFAAAGNDDLRTLLDPALWQRLCTAWAIRHVHTHNDGIVDAKFLTRVPASSARIGQRVGVTEQLCRQAIDDTEELIRALSGFQP